MILFLISAIVGFSCLIIWDVNWVFWTIGLLLILGGCGAGVDDRKRDGRFRTGYKNNAEDQSDIGLAIKFILIGVLVCILAYHSRDLVAWFRNQYLQIQSWLNRNFWWSVIATSFVTAILAFLAMKSFISRIKHKSNIQRLREELDQKARNELEELQQKSPTNEVP